MQGSFGGQVNIYLGKCFRLFKNEKTWKSFIGTVIIAVLVCFVTGEEMFCVPMPTQKGNFALASACIWIGIFNSIQSICRERAIVKREHRTGMMIPAYLTAHYLYEALLCLAEALIMVVAVYLFNTDVFPEDGVLMPAGLEMFIDYFLILYSADLLAVMISCICHSETTAMTVMPFILIVQLIFAGLIFKLEGFSEAVSTLTVSRWGLASLCVTTNVNELPSFLPIWEAVEDYEFEVANQLKLWLSLLGFSVGYGLLSMLILRGVDHDKR